MVAVSELAFWAEVIEDFGVRSTSGLGMDAA